MKVIGITGTATLSLSLLLLLGIAAPGYAQQERADQQQEQKDKPAEKKAPEDKSAKQNGKTQQQQDKNGKPEEKNAQQQDKNNNQEEKNAQRQDNNTKQEEKNPEQTQRAAGNHGGRIPEDRYRASFGREHSFRVRQDDYSRDRRFQYGGYWFGFVDAWPSNWLYTEDVFVVEIDGVYYLCNPMYPGINVTLSIAD
jgi:hypothetical protein